MISLVRKALKKPVDVVAFRLQQVCYLEVYRRAGLWQKSSLNVERAIDSLPIKTSSPVLLSGDLGTLGDKQKAYIAETCASVMASNFDIFSHKVPKLDEFDFKTDWRFGKNWKNQYYKNYSFYVKKETPYDVKFPWELSRFHFLAPVLLQAVLNPETSEPLSWVFKILSYWREHNAVAYSVNWYPMEASMRAINLTFLLDILSLMPPSVAEPARTTSTALRKLLLTMIFEHANFVWINKEYTDVRGNHFTANLVALDLTESVLSQQGLGHKKWRSYVDRHMEREIELQFFEDGVNFEKSCSYHKLVLELFMLSFIASQKRGCPFSEKTKLTLKAATLFSDAVTQPDLVGANFGDNDGAVALPFEFENPNCHGSVVSLARGIFNEGLGTTSFKSRHNIAAALMANQLVGPAAPKLATEHFEFKQGGFVITRNRKNGFYFMADVGEVGMKGRGGHGHNDILSFVLFISGQPVVCDSGCSGYTADLDKKTYFRSTDAHATIKLYGAEIARFSGHWAIKNDAQPCDVMLELDGDCISLSAGHIGYKRELYNGKVQRHWTIDAAKQIVTINDQIALTGENTTAQWAFPLGTNIPSEDNEAVVQTHRLALNTAILEFDQQLAISLKTMPFSKGYGHEELASVLSGEAAISAGHEHNYTIKISSLNVNDIDV